MGILLMKELDSMPVTAIRKTLPGMPFSCLQNTLLPLVTSMSTQLSVPSAAHPQEG